MFLQRLVLGLSRSLDYAANYLIKTFASSDPRASALQTSVASLNSYGRAIIHPRYELLTLTGQSLGPPLIAAMVLGHIDNVSLDSGHDRFNQSFLHRAGASAILSSTPSLRELGMMVICADRSMFVDSCLTDTISPYDQPQWLDAVLPERTDGLWQLSDLQRTTMRLSIKLPGLLHEIRAWKLGQRQGMRQSILDLIIRLMNETSDEAEDWMLHRVRLERTIDPGDRQLIPYSYIFSKPQETTLAVRYWENRLLTVHLHRLIGLCGRDDDAAAKEIVAEEDRLATNILMSWQYAYANRPGITMVMTATLMCLWAVLGSRTEFKNRPISFLGDRLRHHLQYTGAGGVIVRETQETMDETAGIFLGGPITGQIAELAALIHASKNMRLNSRAATWSTHHSC